MGHLGWVGGGSGDTLELAEGDAASFNRGTKVRWTIHRPVIEFFVYSS